MATIGQLIDRVSKNLGGGGNIPVGVDRVEILADFRDLLLVDFADRLRSWSEGRATLAVGGGGAPASGQYAWPSSLRSLRSDIWIDDEPMDPHQIHTDPVMFYRERDLSDLSTGTPTAVLIEGRKLWFRPVPTVAATVTLFGTIYRTTYTATDASTVDVENGMTENSVTPGHPYDQLLVAGSTVLSAARAEMADALALWSTIWDRRMSGAQKAGEDTVRWTEGPVLR